MIRRVTIVPTITTADPAVYRSQMERINLFSHHVHIDVTDGVFAKNQTIRLGDVAWPQGWQADLHLMVAEPSKCVGDVIRKMPSLCSFHAEVQEDLTPSFAALKEKGIKTGLVLLQSTFPGAVKQYIEMVDHVLIFAGQLGMQGGTADMMQMEKIALIRAIKPDVEIGWDGGANMTNIRALAHADLDIINVGSALAKAENPKAVYEEMVAEIDKSGVML
jgi:ribulose-phosphate 3-epimerase